MNLEQQLALPPNLRLARRLKIVVWVVSVCVLLLVGGMRQVRITLPDGVSLEGLPAVYSVINVGVAVLLVVAWVAIRRGRLRWHRRAIHAALIGSLLFLGLYVAYHVTTPEKRFAGEGGIKLVYLLLLASHIVLAAGSLPFILMTWVYAVTNQFAVHRKMARIVIWVWLYVAVSGPVCYLMLWWVGSKT